MMTNLFSMFNPSSIFNLSLNWLSSMLIIILVPTQFWILNSRMMKFMNISLNFLLKELILVMKNNNLVIIFLTLFLMILLNNFSGLMPFIFTSTSHLSMTLTFSVPMWLSLIMFSWLNNTNSMLSHLVPNSTPTLLMPLMVLIELTSNLIRPITLAVRLCTNMIAGHLLITLLSSLNKSISILIFPLFLLVMWILLMLEIAVSIIQAYVFMTLSSLYSKETY
uniref:ATP synthase subunit a n=1 Tax=Dipseudopsis sp. XG-2021 TaxID=2996733 RepID=A0A9E8RSL1_9NEOP|nr:ATP synthase F0 subunit 6 [Dipseudopsis sp. XG-2021]